jgi:uncharacterized protein (DUF433 family)
METTDPASPWYPYVWIDPERMGGTPCFRNSRVPVQNLFDYLEDDYTVEEFLEHFPPLTREQVQAVIQLAAKSVPGAAAA